MSVFSFESVIVGYILFSVVLQPVPENFFIEPLQIGSFFVYFVFFKIFLELQYQIGQIYRKLRFSIKRSKEQE